MTKELALETVKLLAALESWGFTMKEPIPDYLHEPLTAIMEELEVIILEDGK